MDNPIRDIACTAVGVTLANLVMLTYGHVIIKASMWPRDAMRWLTDVLLADTYGVPHIAVAEAVLMVVTVLTILYVYRQTFPAGDKKT